MSMSDGCSEVSALMTEIYIVPNALSEAINKALNAAFEACPAAEKDREHLYNQLLEHFNEHGEIPSFSLQKIEDANA